MRTRQRQRLHPTQNRAEDATYILKNKRGKAKHLIHRWRKDMKTESIFEVDHQAESFGDLHLNIHTMASRTFNLPRSRQLHLLKYPRFQKVPSLCLKTWNLVLGYNLNFINRPWFLILGLNPWCIILSSCHHPSHIHKSTFFEALRRHSSMQLRTSCIVLRDDAQVGPFLEVQLRMFRGHQGVLHEPPFRNVTVCS